MDPSALIPHRSPWLFVDRVEVRGDEASALRLVTANDPMDDDGALPAWVLVEALAQTAAAVMGAARADRHLPATHRGYLAEIRSFAFPRRATTGSCVSLFARRVRSFGRFHRFTARAEGEGGIVAQGEMTFAVEEGP